MMQQYSDLKKWYANQRDILIKIYLVYIKILRMEII